VTEPTAEATDPHDPSGAYPRGDRPVAVVTGGGSGIGAATAERLVADGFDVVVTGRRLARLEAVARRLTGPTARVRAVVMDVSDRASVAAAVAEIGRCDVLVNNAGGALGTEPVESGDPDDWRAMFDSNVLGTLHVVQALLPALRRSPRATIVTITSIAADVTYPGGAGYTAAKHAQRALVETLRLELNGERVRVVEVSPGMVHTEGFSLTRLRGDQDKADAVYEGVDRPLVADDVAVCVAFCVGLPQHVTIDRLVVKPVAQAAPSRLHRGPIDWGHADG
jgi:NADP-dependent 3-hydroxy acid dehydrogenase YdfG